MWTHLKALMELEVQHYPLGEWAVVYGPEAFTQFLINNVKSVPALEPLAETMKKELHMRSS